MNKLNNFRKKRHLFHISFIFQLPFYMHIFTTANSRHKKASLKGIETNVNEFVNMK